MSDIDRVLRSNLKLKHLQLVVALDEFRHLGRSAEFLALTQPAVSKSLAEIERMFGLRLFVRSTRGTEPTAYGEKVARFARAVLADFDRTREDITAIASGGAGRVRLGTMVVAMPALVAPAVGLLKARAPHTAVSVEEGDLSRLLPRLRVCELDLIVGRLEPGYAAPDLETEPLYTEGMRVVVHPDHPLARRRKPRWADLATQPWVVPPAWASSRVKLYQLFYRHRLDPPANVIESASYLVTLTFVQRMGCAAFVADDVARQLQTEGLAVGLPIDVPIDLPPVGLLRLRSSLRTPAGESLVQALRDCARLRTKASQRPASAAPRRGP